MFVLVDMVYVMYFNYLDCYELSYLIEVNVGLVFKVYLNLCYVIDGCIVVVFVLVCQCVGVFMQCYEYCVDLLCGLMIGLLVVVCIGIFMVDVGVVQLVMYFV